MRPLSCSRSGRPSHGCGGCASGSAGGTGSGPRDRFFQYQTRLRRFHARHADGIFSAATTGKRILLADFDLTGGTIGFYLKLSHNYSLVDALQHAEHLDMALWNSLTVNHGGVDILPSPAAPYAEPLDPGPCGC